MPRAASITRRPSPEGSDTQERSARVTKPPFLLARAITDEMIESRSGSAVGTRFSYHDAAELRRLVSVEASSDADELDGAMRAHAVDCGGDLPNLGLLVPSTRASAGQVLRGGVRLILRGSGREGLEDGFGVHLLGAEGL